MATGPDVSGLELGALVAVDGLVTCGRCWWCQRHQLTLCDSIGSIGMHADGGLADFITVPAVGCIPVADHVGSDTAALAEPLAVAVRGLRRGRLAGGESVVIFGAGMIGLGALVAARAYGAGLVTVVSPGQSRRDLAISLGADLAIDPSTRHLTDELRTSHGGRGPDLVIEASGDAQAIVDAICASRKGGRTVLIGFPPAGSSVNLLPVPVGEREVIGSLSHV